MSKALHKFVKREQKALWDDLDNAMREAYDGIWSIKCGHIAARIIEAARLVGPTPPAKISWWRLYRSDVYGAILDAGEVHWVPLDAVEVGDLDEMMERHRDRGPSSGNPARSASYIKAHPSEVRP